MSASEQIAVERFGSGQAILLLHGGAGPELTWERQMGLAQRWSLIIPTGRSAGAEDVRRLLTKRTHLVGFAQGALGVALAAQESPALVRSLTLVEPPSELTNPSSRDAELDLDALANAGIPAMVVSGDSDKSSDALAKRLHARREIVPTEGEEVPRAPGFNDLLEDFLRGSAGTARSRTA